MNLHQQNSDELTEARRKAITASIRTIDEEELKTLGNQLFPHADEPLRDAFFGFIKENAGSGFHHATSHDGVNFIYCHAKNKGLWFVPKRAKGPMQPAGLAIFKEIVEAK